MEVHLKPKSLDADSTSSNAEQDYIHWKITMENFISPLKITQEGDEYKLLINFPSSTVLTYDKQPYTEAIEILDSIYNKPKNMWYSRHVLLHTKQKQHQSLDDYLYALKNLSKDSSYKTVSSE